MSKVGVADANVDHGGGRLTADLDMAGGALAMLRPGRTRPVAVVGLGADSIEAPGYRREVRSSQVSIFFPI